MLYEMKLSLLVFCSIVTNINAQSFTPTCGGRYTTVARALTIDSGATECLYSLENSKVAVTGTSQTLSATETVTFVVPAASGASSASQSNAAFVNYYKSARTIALFKTTAASSSLALSYAPTIAAGTTETTLGTSIACGGIISTTTGQITQPSGSSAMSCYWVFSSDANATVTLTISDVVATGGACATDYLQINNFTSTDTRTFSKYCSGAVTGGTFAVNSSTIIQYVVGSTGSTALTFKIAYTVTPPKNGAGTLYTSWTTAKTLISLAGLIYLGKAVQQ